MDLFVHQTELGLDLRHPVGQHVAQQVEIALNDGDRIVHLMRGGGRDLAHRCKFLGQDQLARRRLDTRVQLVIPGAQFVVAGLQLVEKLVEVLCHAAHLVPAMRNPGPRAKVTTFDGGNRVRDLFERPEHASGPAKENRHRKDYNTERPHSRLGWQTPAGFAQTFTPQRGLTLRARKAPRQPPLPNPPKRAKLKPRVSLSLDKRRGQRHEAKRMAATDIIRSLVKEIVLTPGEDELKIDVRGDLAGILAVSLKTKTPATRAGGSQVMVVAGGRNHQDLRTQKSRPVGAADVHDLVSQVDMVAGARNHLNLLFRAAA